MRGLFTELSVPFEDAELSNDELVRRLELVRTNIGLIAPFRPESYKIVLYAGVEKSPKPQLLMLLPSGCFVYSELNPERLLDSIDYLTWDSLTASKFFPAN